VDRKTGYVLIGKLTARTASATNARLRMLMAKHPESFTTITADNRCEFHAYRDLEEETSVEFYFANPYHSWERGTNENTNGLIRQYLPKGCSMDDLSQARCNAIARKLNDRPRKRHGFRTPAELFEKSY
jgi:IS30 family transposase